jgi:hypothetical protein
MASGSLPASTGPLQIGLEKHLGNPATVGSIAAHYRTAFLAEKKTYPYFAKDKHA